MSRTERYQDGVLVHAEEIDTTAETVTITDADGNETVEAVDPDVLAELKRAEREERQLDRLDQSLVDLKAAPRLTVADYNLDGGPADLRDAAQQINELRNAVKDLIRVVRNLEAEDN